MDLKEITSFLTDRIRIPLTDAAKLAAQVRVRVFKSNETIFEQGEMNDFTYLVLSGLAYVFYLHPEGREKVKRFVSRGDTLAPFVSILTSTPSHYSARALTKTLCLQFRYKDFSQLVSRSWTLERALRRELEFQIIEREKKEHELFMLTAQERYSSFVERHRSLVEQIPLKLIASYINVDPATLSRLRSETNP